MTGILAEQSDKCRAEGEALIRKADNLACQSWNERMWSDGGPAQPSPTIEQAINGGYPWLERYIWTKNQRSLLVSWPRPLTLRRKTIS
jgi:hypothetical protein